MFQRPAWVTTNKSVKGEGPFPGLWDLTGILTKAQRSFPSFRNFDQDRTLEAGLLGVLKDYEM